jgi:hypothetical protein
MGAYCYATYEGSDSLTITCSEAHILKQVTWLTVSTAAKTKYEKTWLMIYGFFFPGYIPVQSPKLLYLHCPVSWRHES